MTGHRRRRMALLWAAALAAGCSPLLPAEPPLVTSLLDQMPTGLPHASPSPATLLVAGPLARPLADTVQMAYTLRPHHVAYYARNQWAEAPPRMLHPLLVRTLEATGRFAAVLTPPGAGATSYTLRTELLDLVQDYTQDPPVVRVSLRLQLAEGRADRVLGVREIRLQEAMQAGTPQAGVAAANHALARALHETAAFVIEKTQ